MTSLLLFAFLAASSPLAQADLKLTVPLPELEAIARLDSTDAAAQYDLGIGYWSKKRFDEAERALRRAVAIEPQFAAGYLALAYLPLARTPALYRERSRGKVREESRAVLDESERLQRRAFMLDPLVDVSIIGAALRRIGAVPRTWANDPFLAYISGDYQWTYFLLTKFIGAGPGASRDSVPDAFYWYRGLAAGHLGNYGAASMDLSVLLQRAQRLERSDTVQIMTPRTNEYRYLIAFFRQKAELYAQALAWYRVALEYDGGLFMAHVQMGRICVAQKSWDEAVTHFQQAVATNPEDASILIELGLAYWEAGRIGDAVKTFQLAQENNPLDARAPYLLGRMQLLSGDSATARLSFTRFLSLAPRSLTEQINDAKARLATLP